MVVGLVAALAACYLPNKFMSEIRLSRQGAYGLYYKGELTWAPLYREIRQGKLTPEEAAAKITEIDKDLRRDSHFKSIASTGEGHFDVEYEREGQLGPSGEVTFVRRNAIILMIKATPDGLITVNGQSLKPSDAQTTTNLGLDIQGEFRIVTDALVKEHNATMVKPFNGYKVYIWTIQNAFSPSPHFVMQRDGAWQAPSKP